MPASAICDRARDVCLFDALAVPRVRHTADLPDSAHEAQNLWTHRPATPFESGMFTMYREVLLDFNMDSSYRLLALVSLSLLAVLPMRAPRRAVEHADRANAPDTTSPRQETDEPR